MLEYQTKEIEVDADEFFVFNTTTNESLSIDRCRDTDLILLNYQTEDKNHNHILTFNELKQLLFSKELSNDSRKKQEL